MPDLFHNPYQFIPLPEKGNPDGLPLTRDQEQNRAPGEWPSHLTHDRFVEDALSGRLICRAVLCELLAVGSQQTEADKARGRARQVELFEIDGVLALPASSLRGMISALAEAACGSALRVLVNKELSIFVDQRKQPLGRTFDYFDSELLPLTLGIERARLSLAEQMFGVVEDAPAGTDKPAHWRAFALASRLRFSNALAHGPVERSGKAGRTQILASPKSMSHNMYFEPKTGPGFIPKGSLDSKKHRAKGRKMYLHRKVLTDQDWKTSAPDTRADQKADVAPLSGGEFWFHVDFDNLSSTELRLLCYALRPTEPFCHKLGLGKPLGLGKLRLDPAGLFLINRHQRYSDPSPVRYHQGWRNPDISDYPSHYRREFETAPGQATAPAPPDEAAAWRQQAPAPLKKILEALELLGDPEKVQQPVHYPQIDQERGKPLRREDPAFEDRLFSWFQKNDASVSGQYLNSLLGQTQLPILDRVADSQGRKEGGRGQLRSRGGEPSQGARGSQAPASAQAVPSPPATARDLIGGVHPFRVTKLNSQTGKLQFECALPDFKHLPGALDGQGKAVVLKDPDLRKGTVLKLLVRNYNNASFQLALPPPGTI